MKQVVINSHDCTGIDKHWEEHSMQCKGLRLALAATTIGFILLISTNASLVGNIVIQNIGKIGIIVTADSGLAADIQKAVNTVYSRGGGTVIIPAGNWTWNNETVTIPAGVNVIGTGLAGCKGHEDNWEHYTAQTILHNICPPPTKVMFRINNFNPPPGTPHTATRISGIQFEATPPTGNDNDPQSSSAIQINQVHDFRVDHCTFVDFTRACISVNSNDGGVGVQTSYGVVDHCVFTQPYKTTQGNWYWGYGVDVYGSGNVIPYTAPGWTYNVTYFFGKYVPPPGYSIVYVEDCHFKYLRHHICNGQLGWYCSRFNLFEYMIVGYWTGIVDTHGNVAGGWGPGGRGMEIYNCTLKALPPELLQQYTWTDGETTAVYFRGGAGLVYNNTYYGNNVTRDGREAFVTLSNADDQQSNPYMAYWNNSMDCNQIYIWNNTYYNTSFLKKVDSEGYRLLENVHYFLRAPNLEQDGFTYTPYPYPHPSTLK